jgi:deoxyribonuclease IV
MPLLLGAHTSAAGGAYKALLEGKEIGATVIQFFTANQKRWESKPLDAGAIEEWNKTLKETGLSHIMSHDSYLINLGSPDPTGLEKSRKAFQTEFHRCEELGVTYLNFHPGAALDDTPKNCLNRIVNSLLELEPFITKSSPRLLLETTAGQGSAVGWQFEELGYIIEQVGHRIPLGVCIDTCHIFAAGYDIRTAAGWEATLKEFDETIGLKHLYAFHINDSVKGLGTRVDRHAALGKGEIGLPCFEFLMNDPRTRSLPKYLETPGGPPLWKEEISLLKQIAH